MDTFICHINFAVLILGLVATADVHGQSIISGPSNVNSKTGGTAEFSCKADFAGGIETMKWKFNNEIIYAFEKGQEVFPWGRDKYSVKHDGRTFNLTVNKVNLASGGEYSCQLTTNTSTALLTVLDTPEISTSHPNIVAGSEVEYICQAQFTGPSNSENFPQLRMFFDSELVNLPTQKQQLEGPNSWYQLTQTYNVVPDASTDGKKIMCAIGTSNPVINVKVTTEVIVLYWVHDINYIPIQKEYEVGKVINCTANGRPEPQFTWSDNKDPGNLINRQSLEVTQEMLGSNSWTCTARNTISGKLLKKSVVVDFEAVHSDIPTGSGNDAWKIGVGVGISIAICLVGIIGTVLYCRVKRKNSSMAINCKEGNSDPSGHQKNEKNRQLMETDKKNKISKSAKYKTSNCKDSEQTDIMLHDKNEEQHSTLEPMAYHREKESVGSKGIISKPQYNKGSNEELNDQLENASLVSKCTTDVDGVQRKSSRPEENADSKIDVKSRISKLQSQKDATVIPSANYTRDGTKQKRIAGDMDSAVNSTNGANVLGAKAKDTIKTSDNVAGAQPSQNGNQAKQELLDNTISTKDEFPSVAKLRETFKGSTSRDTDLKDKILINRQTGNINVRDDVLEDQKEINMEKCFHGILPKEMRKMLLMKDGDFLLTKGSPEAEYELTFLWKGNVETSPLEYKQRKWWTSERNDYDSIQDLLSTLTSQQRLLAGKAVSLKRVVELQQWELTNTSDIVLDCRLADGNLSEVSGGSFKGERVAVKIYNQAGSEDEQQAFFNDVDYLRRFNHENIATFIGITVSKPPVIAVLELQSKGGLLNFLHQHKKKLKDALLIKMCAGVVDGMEHLRKNEIIHRDIAARNCLVGKGDTVKICNFFMARKVKGKKEYQADKSEPVQVRWAAPEVLKDSKYSTDSDIWSFGVLMWEIYSYGETPYQEVADDEICYCITRGNKLPTPDGMPKEISSIMQGCWMEENNRHKTNTLQTKFRNASKKYQ